MRAEQPLAGGEQAALAERVAAEGVLSLVRYAILAPSVYNSQPWRFAIGESEVRLFVDRSRWLRVADTDQRELYLSVGCALENLLIAAEHAGLAPRVSYLPDAASPDLAALVALAPGGSPSPKRPPALLAAIPMRETNRLAYEPRPIPREDLARLQAFGSEDGVETLVSADPDLRYRVAVLVARGDLSRYADPAYRRERGRWIGRGAFGDTWLGARIGQLVVTAFDLGERYARRDSQLVLGAPALAIVHSAGNDRAWQVRAGQALERVWLGAAALGISVQPLSQPLQIPALKAELATLLPRGAGTPQQLLRLGYAAPERRHTPRRALSDVLGGG